MELHYFAAFAKNTSRVGRQAALMHSIATDPAYRTGILTWEEQRSFVPNAVAALTSPKTEKLAAAIKAEWADIKAAPFSAVGFAEVASAPPCSFCAYKALHNKDTLHIKHYIIRTRCI